LRLVSEYSTHALIFRQIGNNLCALDHYANPPYFSTDFL